MLIKYLLLFFMINGILLTNNYILLAKAQEHSPETPATASTNESETPTVDTPTPSDTSIPSHKDIIASLPQAKLQCLADDDSFCAKANHTLLSGCNGVLTTPDQYITNDKIFAGTYEPQVDTLAKCMCNQVFYNQLSGCIECFKNYTNAHFEIAPVTRFQILCVDKFSTQFTESPPDTTKSSSKVKYYVGVGVAVLLLIIFGIIGYLCFVKRRKNKNKKPRFPITLLNGNNTTTPLMKKHDSTMSNSFANNNRSELDVNYPPPTSLENVSHHYPPPNLRLSHPPSNTSAIPPPVSQQQQPPSPPSASSDYQQQQNYYPTSSNQPVSNIQIPTQSASGEIPYYPPPANPSDLLPYPGPQNNNPPGSYYDHQY